MRNLLKKAYNDCNSNGFLYSLSEIDISTIKTFLVIAEEDLKTIADLKLTKARINTLYKLNYEVIHTLAEAVLLLDKVKSTNHLCLFAHLCFKHPNLKLNYEFLETIRKKRNKIHYEGSFAVLDDWNLIEQISELHIHKLTNYIKNELKLKS